LVAFKVTFPVPVPEVNPTSTSRDPPAAIVNDAGVTVPQVIPEAIQVKVKGVETLPVLWATK
jgi:hypothetical protein